MFPLLTHSQVHTCPCRQWLWWISCLSSKIPQCSLGTHFAQPHLTNRQLLRICTWAQNTGEGGEAKPHSWSGCTEAATILKGPLVGTIDVTLCLVTQSCPALCYPMGCSPPGSSVHGDSPGKNTAVGCHALLQGESSQLRDWTQVSLITGRFFTIWAIREAPQKNKFDFIVDVFLYFKHCILLLLLQVKNVAHVASLVAQMVKNLPAMQETWIRSLGWEDPLKKGMATLSSILAWRTPMDRGA